MMNRLAEVGIEWVCVWGDGVVVPGPGGGKRDERVVQEGLDCEVEVHSKDNGHYLKPWGFE